jgi:hypothetical protein
MIDKVKKWWNTLDSNTKNALENACASTVVAIILLLTFALLTIVAAGCIALFAYGHYTFGAICSFLSLVIGIFVFNFLENF